MAIKTSTPPRQSRQPGVASARFTWTFVVLCVWLMAGAYLDPWQHENLTRPVTSLLHPSHLLLMLTGGLIVSGPLRAATRRGGKRATWPAIISGALTLSMLTFFLQFDNPFIDRWAAGTVADPRGPMWMEEELGMIGLILYAAILAGLLVILLRRFDVPIGAVTVILTINALLVSPVANHTELVVAALLGGVAGDLLLYVLRPSPARPYGFPP